MGVQHIKKFDGGRRTPQEYHAQFAFPIGAKCVGCQGKPCIRAIVMMPLDEAAKHGQIPPGADKAPLLFPQLAPFLVPIKGSDGKPSFYVRTSMAYSCTCCRRDLEKALAKAPSWAIVEINEGPDARNRVQVGHI